jgi:hypothetical protein
MKRKFTVIFIGLLHCLSGNAQKPEELLSGWSAKSPIEKAYLHFDRDNYIAGETAWFKAYLYSDFYPDTISTTLYVELINESSVVLNRKIVPVFWGAARGQLEIPDSLVTGSYTIRAYSATMLNHAEDFIFKRSIFIYGKKNDVLETATTLTKMVRLEFFPEGGNLVNGFINAVAFKATNESGLPVSVNGSLHNQKDQELASFSSYHDGMGMFEFTPVANEKYYVLLAGDALNRNYLPVSAEKGIAIAVVTNQRELSFEIQQQITDPSFLAAYIIGQMQHHVIFRQELAAGKQKVSGVVNTQNLNSGILQITAFNSDGFPLAERLCFIDNKEYIQQAELIADTISFSEKAKNHFSLVMKDTVLGSFSVSVSDPAYDMLPVREHNIFSGLLLTSDIKGYVHQPSWYFTGNADSARRAMDLVMMTNGWRRFKWDDLIKNKVPENKYKDLSYISLSGRANLMDSKKGFAEKELLIAINNADSTSTVELVTTDKQGHFRLDSMFFWGNTRLLFGDSRGNKSQFIEIKMSADSLAKLFPFRSVEKIPSVISDALITSRQTKLAVDYDEIQKASGIMLEGITVKGKRKKTPTQEVEEKYTTGLFTGISDRTIDLVNSDEPMPQRNIFEYLQSRVPGITITPGQTGFSDDYILYYRGGQTMSLRSPVPMLLYLNEMKVEAASIAAIRASDISLVKVYSSFVGAEHNGAGGVLSVYTKKGADTYASQASSTYQVNYKGYSVRKEFYSPDYKVDVAEKYKTDNRITLQWLPDFFVGDVNPRMPIIFYNNDRTKQFKVVIEGITTNGKMLMIEKIFSAKAF